MSVDRADFCDFYVTTKPPPSGYTRNRLAIGHGWGGACGNDLQPHAADNSPTLCRSG